MRCLQIIRKARGEVRRGTLLVDHREQGKDVSVLTKLLFLSPGLPTVTLTKKLWTKLLNKLFCRIYSPAHLYTSYPFLFSSTTRISVLAFLPVHYCATPIKLFLTFLCAVSFVLRRTRGSQAIPAICLVLRRFGLFKIRTQLLGVHLIVQFTHGFVKPQSKRHYYQAVKEGMCKN